LKKLLVYIILTRSLVLFSQTFSDFTNEQLRDDIEYVYNSIKLIHPNSDGLSLDSKTELLASITNEYYSEADAFFVLNKLLNHLNDGHSNIKFSSTRAKDIMKYAKFFPYELDFFDSTAVIVGHINGVNSDVIGKEISLVLDGDIENPIFLNDSIVIENSSRNVNASVLIENLEIGEHTIAITVWDVHGNVTTEEIIVNVGSNREINVSPNPVEDKLQVEIQQTILDRPYNIDFSITNPSGVILIDQQENMSGGPVWVNRIPLRPRQHTEESLFLRGGPIRVN